MDIAGTQTEQNFKKALIGEHNCFTKFLSWRSIADVVGPPEIFDLYRATKLLIAGHAGVNAVYIDILTELTYNQVHDHDHAHDHGPEFSMHDVEHYHEYADVARQEGFDEMAEWFELLADAEHSQLPPDHHH